MGVVACVLLFFASGIVYGQTPTGLSERRERDQQLYEQCFTSDFGSTAEAENCTNWIAQSACDGIYVDNRGDIDGFTARENLNRYLMEADKKVSSMKGCDPMGSRNLILSLIARDRQASDKDQLERWRRVLKDASKLLAEQRRYLCLVAAQDDAFATLMHTKGTRESLMLCLKDEVHPEAYLFFERVAQEAPELVDDNILAVLAISEAEANRYAMARNHLDAIDIRRLSEGVRSQLLLRMAPLGTLLYKEGLDDALRPHVGFELRPDAHTDRRLAFLQAVISEPKASVSWYAELEAVILLQRGDMLGVAKRAVNLMSMSSGRSDAETKAKRAYLLKLVKHGAVTHNIRLLKHLALAFGTADGAARSAVTPEVYAELSKPLLDAVDTLMQLTLADSGKGKRGSKVSSEDMHVLESLLRLSDDAHRFGVQLKLGEAHALNGNHAEALKVWYALIGSSRRGAEVEEAWYLSIVTLRQTKQQAEADKQLEAFESRYPSSSWLRWLK